MNIVFLHIPKTAGQSIHHGLVSTYGPTKVFPARENQQLYQLPINAYRNYKIFSGHLDWDKLDAVSEPKIVFTVLRDPLERILSFYFFLRKTATTLSETQLQEKKGVQNAYAMTPDDYFLSNSNPGFRNFIENHFDNFYTYYFAGRCYRGRELIKPSLGEGKIFPSTEALADFAASNLRCLNLVIRIDACDKIFDILRDEFGCPTPKIDLPKINVNSEIPVQQRLEKLIELGASEETINRLKEYSKIDQILMSEIFSDGPIYINN